MINSFKCQNERLQNCDANRSNLFNMLIAFCVQFSLQLLVLKAQTNLAIQKFVPTLRLSDAYG